MQNIKKVLVNHRDFFFIFLGCFGLKAAYANGKKIVVPLDFFLYRSYQFYLQANTGFEHRTSEYWGDHATTISAGKLSEWNSYFCFSVIALEYNTIVQNKERKKWCYLITCTMVGFTRYCPKINNLWVIAASDLHPHYGNVYLSTLDNTKRWTMLAPHYRNGNCRSLGA